MGQRIGYRRVSTLVQNMARQLEGVDAVPGSGGAMEAR